MSQTERTFLLLWMLTMAGQPALAAPPEDRGYAEPLRATLIHPLFYDFSPEEYWQTPQKSWWLDTSDWIMDQREDQSEQIEAFGSRLDRYLSGDAGTPSDNNSYLRLGMATRWEKGDLPSMEPEARFRLDLPALKKKLRLIIESDSDDFLPLSEQKQSHRLTASERTNTAATGALRWLSQIKKDWALTSDVGIRTHWPPKPFWRARSRALWHLNRDWDLQLDQRIYYFHIDGWGESSRFAFTRWLTNEWFFTAASEARWNHSERNFELSQIVALSKALNSRLTVIPQAGAIGDSKPSWKSREFFLDATWRYRLHKDWLFAEAIPAISAPRENDFRANPSMTLRIEMLFIGRDD